MDIIYLQMTFGHIGFNNKYMDCSSQSAGFLKANYSSGGVYFVYFRNKMVKNNRII